MSDSPSERDFLTSALARWRRELADLDRKREGVVQKVETAERLLGLLVDEPSPPVAAHGTPESSGQPLLFATPKIQAHVELPSDAKWIEAIRAWIDAAPLGLDYAELRALVDAHPAFAARFRASDKGYYGSISRLAAKREIIKHNGRLFSPSALERFKGEVAAGKLDDERPIVGSHSPMGEAILDIVGAHRSEGILGKDIIASLRADPEFNAALTPHTSGAYNVIARLVKRNQILRRDDGLCFPGIKFPPRDPGSKWLKLKESVLN